MGVNQVKATYYWKTSILRHPVLGTEKKLLRIKIKIPTSGIQNCSRLQGLKCWCLGMWICSWHIGSDPTFTEKQDLGQCTRSRETVLDGFTQNAMGYRQKDNNSDCCGQFQEPCTGRFFRRSSDS